MRSTFFGLEIGRKSLMAQQRALDVVGHNVANANTPGFSRQEAVMVTSYPDNVPSLNQPSAHGLVGTGVMVAEIARVRNSFFDQRYREQSIDLGRWQQRQSELERIELLFNEATETGLSSVYDNFWQAWQELAKTPESLTVRAIVRERGNALAETMNLIYSQFKDARITLNQTLEIKMREINSYAEQIAQLNGQIQAMELAGGKANDLRDRRDYLLDQLSKVINIRVSQGTLSEIRVSIGNYDLVDGQTVNRLRLSDTRTERGVMLNDLEWETTGEPVEILGGEVAAILEVRDVEIPYYINKLDELAEATIVNTNTYHIEGYGLADNGPVAINGGSGVSWSAVSIDAANTRWGEWKVEMTSSTDFQVLFLKDDGSWETVGTGQLGTEFNTGGVAFTLTGTAAVGDAWTFTTVPGDAVAGTPPRLGAPLFFNPIDKTGLTQVISLNAAILGEEGLQRIAASLEEGKRGNGDNALRLAQLKHDFLMSGGEATFNDFIRSLTGKLAVDAQEAKRNAENQNLLVEQIDNLRQEVSSVSLDEEMTNMVRFQQAYNAAARLVTAVDEMIEVIVNRMGLVGRG